MAPRKSAIRSAPRRPELEQLLEQARVAGVTDDMLQEQRVSFAYGNAPENSRITRNPRAPRRAVFASLAPD